MKTFSKLLATAALVVGLASCESTLNILPPLDLANEVALTSTRGLQTALTGAYSTSGGISDGSMLAGNGITTGELWADNALALSPGFGQQQIVTRTLNFFNDQGRPIWQNSYGVINRVNNVLDALPTVSDAQIDAAAAPGATIKNRDLIKGESLFLRGWMYLQIVSYFAQPWGFTADNSHPGVVIRLTSTRSGSGQAKARSTVKETYDQIIKDLTDAEAILPASHPTGRATKGAAAALLARVYFQQNDFTNAAAAATRVINSGLYALTPGVRDPFDNNSTSEAIFELQSTDQNDASGAVVGTFRQVDDSQSFIVDPDFSALLFANKGDNRQSLVVQRDGQTYVSKYDRLVMNVPLIRYAEILLIRAEATAQSSTTTALADANAVRTRAGLPALKGLTSDALVSAIRLERRFELMFEGNRFHELKRTKQNVRGTPWNNAQLIFKIPDVEVNANTLCAQNPN